MKPDKNIVIIGAGLGGLMCGAILAKEGYKVTIVEKNPHAGGCLRSYSRHGAVFDTGMHVFGGMSVGGNIHRICEYLGIGESFVSIPFDSDATAEVFFADTKEKIRAALGADRFVDSLSRLFPAEKASLMRYQKAVERVMEDLDLFHLRPTPPTPGPRSEDFMLAADAFIAKYISDPKLRAILASVNLLYAGIAGVTPAYLHCAITSIFLNGACRIAGGYSNFANALCKCISDNGGQIITGAPASKISTNGGIAVEVATAKGSAFPADGVISSIPVDKMLDMIDNNKLLSKTFRIVPNRKNDSLSAFIVNIKLKPRTLKFSNSIGFYLRNSDSPWSADTSLHSEKFMYMTPPAENQGECAETLCIVAPMRWEDVQKWENTSSGNRDAEYTAFKNSLASFLISKLSDAIPELQSAIEAIDTSSPLTIRDFTGVRHGAMCGYRNDRADDIPFLPVTTRIPNLYITGQSVNMHGFCGVTLTAVQTCEAILGENFLIEKFSSL